VQLAHFPSGGPVQAVLGPLDLEKERHDLVVLADGRLTDDQLQGPGDLHRRTLGVSQRR
jgi:hypothetical protein